MQKSFSFVCVCLCDFYFLFFGGGQGGLEVPVMKFNKEQDEGLVDPEPICTTQSRFSSNFKCFTMRKGKTFKAHD